MPKPSLSELKKIVAKKKKEKQAKKEGRKKTGKTLDVGGPRGGTFRISRTGKKIYEHKNVKKSLEELKEIMDFVESQKQSAKVEKLTEGLKKSLFKEDKILDSGIVKYEPSKDDCAHEFMWAAKKLAELQEVKWYLEEEFPNEKETFNEVYNILVKEVRKRLKEFKDAK